MAVQVPVLAPARQPRLGGLRAAATWITNARVGAAESVVYVSDGCSFPQPAIGLCYGEEVVDEKVGQGIDWYEGIGEPFALYGGVECFLGPDNDFPERARTILIQGEDREIENRLATWAAGGSDLSASADIVEAIAAVEQHADSTYLGRPIILMSRADAIRAASNYVISYGLDGLPYTANGTPVVASGNIDQGVVYGLGAVTVLRSEIANIDAIDYRFNKDFAVAEAVYVLIVDCDYRSFSEIEAP